MVAFKGIEQTYSIEEYLKLEQNSNRKHEFYNGKIKEVPGGTTSHNLIATRIAAILTFRLDDKEDKEYFVLNSDMKIQIPDFNHFVYPDAVVVCEKIKLYKNRKDVIINPLLIVEVLSPSTERHDRGPKFLQYKTLPSFKEYLLISQMQPWVCVETKKRGNNWSNIVTKNLDDDFYLKTIDEKISLKSLYKGVNF